MCQHTVIVPVSVGVASNSAGAGIKNTKRAKTMASSMESRPGLLEMCPNRRKFAQAQWKFAQATVEIHMSYRKFAQIRWKSDQMWAGFLATQVGNPPALGRVPPFPPFLGGPLRETQMGQNPEIAELLDCLFEHTFLSPP